MVPGIRVLVLCRALDERSDEIGCSSPKMYTDTRYLFFVRKNDLLGDRSSPTCTSVAPCSPF